MSLEQIVVRVRPQRVAVILGEHASWREYMRAVAFLSGIWGGRYCPIIVSSEQDQGARARHNLARLRPEVVVLGTVDAEHWSEDRVADICQPRYVGPLAKASSLLGTGFPPNLISARTIVRADMKRFPTAKRSNLIVWEANRGHPLEPYIATLFGMVPRANATAYADALNARYEEFGNDKGVTEYLSVCQMMGRSWCWLDMASSGLSCHTYGMSSWDLPTVVVVSSPVDAALYWNMRSLRGIGCSATLIAFPEQGIENAKSVQALAEWVHRRPVDSNGCKLLSETCDAARLDRLARRLRPRIRLADPLDEEFHVVVDDPPFDVPVVIPVDRETQVRVFPSGPRFGLEIPAPDCSSELSQSESWMCDFLKDPASGRAPWELCPPPFGAAMQILNVPFPPTIRDDDSRLGYGCDSLNARCTKRSTTKPICVASAEELLEGILEARGITVVRDEKRTRYLPAIELLGGLTEAARSFTGNRFEVLSAFLRGGTKGNCEAGEPLTFESVKNRASGFSTDDPGRTMIERITESMPEPARSVARRRHGLDGCASDEASEYRRLINELLARGVLYRKWRLPKCPHCLGKYWVDEVRLNPPARCPGCSELAALTGSVPIGWGINELIPLAIREGMIPVALAARFLRYLTDSGFLWLPGVKCDAGDGQVDLDIIACCDGHLVAAECKHREDSKAGRALWLKFQRQLSRSMAMAHAVGVSVFVVASLYSRYPKSFQRAVAEMADSSMSVLFLTKQDLQEGRRHITRRGVKAHLRLDDVLPHDPAPKPRRKRKRPRLWVRYGRGGSVESE